MAAGNWTPGLGRRTRTLTALAVVVSAWAAPGSAQAAVPALGGDAPAAGALGTVEHVTTSATAQVAGVADTADTTVRRTTAGVTGTADTVVRRTADSVSRTAQPTVEAVRGAPRPEPVESAAGAVGVGAPAEPGATAE